MKLPPKITYTFKCRRTASPYDAFYESLESALKEKISKQSKKVIADALKALGGPGTTVSVCRKAFDIIEDADTGQRDDIIDQMPEELWEMFTEKFWK
ncbi:MAG: hypothetical protein M0R80_00725 [Proteobacteria bacterium]|jgi:hypothetical protein|nr:hypothetical protein [Pseudomonadota bacterium]